jgi:hypothetical protein
MVAYTSGLAEIICQRLADGESLRRICQDDDMPNRSTVFDWLDRIEGFQAAYDAAHERQGHLMAELALEAALEEGDPTDRRLKWDALRWQRRKAGAEEVERQVQSRANWRAKPDCRGCGSVGCGATEACGKCD